MADLERPDAQLTHVDAQMSLSSSSMSSMDTDEEEEEENIEAMHLETILSFSPTHLESDETANELNSIDTGMPNHERQQII